MAKLKRPHDPIQQEYVERELQKLMQEQEMLRQAKGLGGPTEQIPTTGGSGQFGPAEYKYGGKKKYPDGGYKVPKSYYAPQDLSRVSLPNDNMNVYGSPITGEFPIHDLYNNQKQKFDWGEAGVLGAQLAGDIVGLSYSLKKPNYAKYQRISPSLVNYNQAATDITNQAALVENSAAGALRNQGQSSGAYLNNRINLASRLGQQTGAQLAELRMNEANQNVGIKNEALTRNAQIQRAEVETNAKEKDARMQALVGHLGGIGSKVARYNRDKQAMKLDKQQFETLIKLYPELFRDEKVLALMKEQAGK